MLNEPFGLTHKTKLNILLRLAVRALYTTISDISDEAPHRKILFSSVLETVLFKDYTRSGQIIYTRMN